MGDSPMSYQPFKFGEIFNTLKKVKKSGMIVVVRNLKQRRQCAG